MNFISLFSKIGKQTGAVTKQRLTVCLNVADLRELCNGKADWESVTIPVTLKYAYVKGKQPKMYFILDKKRKK